MSACFYCVVGDGDNEVHFAAHVGGKYHDAAADFFFQVVAQRTESVHVHVFYGYRKHFVCAGFLYLAHDVCHFALGNLVFQFLVLGGESFHFVKQRIDSLGEFMRICLSCFGSFQKHLLLILVIFQHVVAGDGLDTAHAGSHAGLGDNLKCLDIAGVGYVSTCTELFGEVAHADHAHLLAVFFTKKRHGSGLFCFFHGHDLCHNRKLCSDFFVDNLFHLCDLFRCHSLEVGEVKTQTVFIVVGTGLLHMASQHGTKCFLQQMSCAVVLSRIVSLLSVDGKGYRIAGLEHTLCHTSDMSDLVSKHLHRIFHHELSVLAAYHAGVGMLSAAGGVKWSLFHEDGSHLSVGEGLGNLRIGGHDCDLGIILVMVVAHKCSGDGRIDGLVNGHIGTHVVGGLSGGSCFHSLLFHAGFEAFLIDAVAFLAEDLLGQIQRKSVSII